MIYNFFKSTAGVRDLKDTQVSSPSLVQTSAVEDLAYAFESDGKPKPKFVENIHHVLEGWPMVFGTLSFIALTVGGLVQIVPLIVQQSENSTTMDNHLDFQPILAHACQAM